MLRAPIQRQASVIAACRVMEVQRSKRRVRANAEFPTNRWRPAGWSATDRVALGGSCWHCGRRAVHCATCRSEGNASIPRAASPVKARHRRHSGRRFSSLATHQMPGEVPASDLRSRGAPHGEGRTQRARSFACRHLTPGAGTLRRSKVCRQGVWSAPAATTGLAADMAVRSSGATKLITLAPPSVYPLT